MSATAFVWRPYVDNFGHVALKINDGPYISWWPSGTPVGPASKGSMFGSKAAASSMRKDKQSEGNRVPDWASAPIQGLKEDKIKLWWRDLSPHSSHQGPSRHGPVVTNGAYDLRDRQCASVVMEALLVGGISASNNPRAFAIMNNSKIMTPLIVKDIVSAVTGELGSWGFIGTQFDYGQILSTSWNYKGALWDFVSD